MDTLNELGEKKIILLLQKYISNQSWSNTNEDAFLYESNGLSFVINIDTMTKKSDFLPGQNWFQLGKKLVTITVSDLAAKGAKPDIFISSLVLESTMDIDAFERLVDGIRYQTDQIDCQYIGGDLGRSIETVLTGCSIGRVGHFISRNKAQPGDIICTTGPFGLTGLGFDLLLNSKRLEKYDISKDVIDMALESIYEPRARLSAGLILSNFNLATSSIDSSDGLAASLHWLSSLSKVKIEITSLPVHPKLDNGLFSSNDIFRWVFFGGEEYELIFTVNPDRLEELKKAFAKNSQKIHVIGQCSIGKGVFFKKKDNIQIEIDDSGWNSFSKKSK